MKTNRLTDNWWMFIVRGILALVFAALAFAMPVEAIMAFAIIFGAFSLADGIMGIIASVRNMKKGERWGWLLFSGILGVLAGIAVILSPWVASVVIASFLWASIGVWSFSMGLLEVISAVRLRKEIEGEIWMALSGIFSMIFGGIIVWMFFTQPESVLLASGWLLGINALLSASTYFFLGFKLKKNKKIFVEVE